MPSPDVRAKLAALGRSPTSADIAEALRSCGQVVSDVAVLSIQDDLRRDSEGIGQLEPLLHLPGVTDILVNGAKRVYVDCGQGLQSTAIRFPSNDEVRHLAVRLAAQAGRRLDDGSPFVDARLPNGVRLHAILAGIAEPGPCISLRIPANTNLSLDDWVSSGSLHFRLSAVLKRVIESRVAFLVSGGTGSGKTTLLASMLSDVPPDHRIVIVEDSRELSPQHPHVINLEARPVNAEGRGLITMTDLVKQGLRMRPDRLVIGEVRGAELKDLLQALNTGHEGGCGTVHANSARDVPARLEALAALGGWGREATHAQVSSALSVVIHMNFTHGRRSVTEIGVFVPDGSGFVRVKTALSLSQGRLIRGEGIEQLEAILE